MSNEKGEVMQRRGTVVEDAAEGLIESKEHKKLEKLAQKKPFGQRLADLGKSIYNSEYKEFLGRDGKDWCQLSMFYFLFYAFLSGFFLLLLLAFHATIDEKIPTYYDTTSIMNHHKVNPGLGFRPQYNPENNLILVNLSRENQWREENVNSLNFFFVRYDKFKDREISIIPTNRDREVSFDYNTILNNTPCAKSNDYGYKSGKPCVLLKINRIYGWKPMAFDAPPKELNVANITTSGTEKRQRYLYINCEGENAFDKDNVGKIDYYSLYPGNEIGGIPTKYFPYLNQPYYMSPFVMAHFKNIAKNTLVNVKCRLWAQNVDNTDNLNLRGMTKFEIFVTS